MKNIYIIIALFIVAMTINAEEVTIDLGASYANDIWYDFKGGVVKVEPKDNWDFAFQTTAQGAGIRINSQKGMELYVVEGSDGDSWEDAIDTTGMTSGWERGHNSTESWALGAFNLGIDGFAGSGDFGWGEYNMVTHTILGSKVFVLKLADGTYLRTMIESLISGVYSVKIAELNGSNEQTFDVPKSTYANKIYVYYNLEEMSIVDREPEFGTWALLFGKYTTLIDMGMGDPVPYGVTGVRTFSSYRSAIVEGAPAEELYPPLPNDDDYSYNISNIGSDWKKLDYETFTYNVMDSIAYFVTNAENEETNPEIFKIVFKEFEGSSTGQLVFDLTVETTSVEELITDNSALIYPNVVEKNSTITVKLQDGVNISRNIIISDILGNVYSNLEYNILDNQNIEVNIPSLSTGAYFINIYSETKVFVSKFQVK